MNVLSTLPDQVSSDYDVLEYRVRVVGLLNDILPKRIRMNFVYLDLLVLLKKLNIFSK